MAEGQGPSEEEIGAFLERLKAFRDTLSEGDQRLLTSMFYAAMGTHEQKDDDVTAYWVVAGPRGVAAGGYGRGIVARPWGAAYNTYYPAYYG